MKIYVVSAFNTVDWTTDIFEYFSTKEKAEKWMLEHGLTKSDDEYDEYEGEYEYCVDFCIEQIIVK